MGHTLITYLRLLRTIPEGDLAVIEEYFEPKAVKEGDCLFEGGKVCRELYFVCRGVLRIVSTNDKGMDVTHYFCKENQFCTILQSFTDETTAASGIQAACDAEVLVISKSRLLELYGLVSYLKELIDQQNQVRLLEKINTRNAFLGVDAETQYRYFIMQQPDIALRVSQKDIASYLGITQQSLSRIRKNIR
jgi:CRP-like cAMP-binding protein